jgi:hypothetical protein
LSFKDQLLANIPEAGEATIIIVEAIDHIRAVYHLAQMLAPAVVILEDLDLITKSRDNPYSYGAISQNDVTGELLQVLSGGSAYADIVTIATTNHPEAIDEALAKRAGRFEAHIRMGYPNDTDKQRIVDLISIGSVSTMTSRGAMFVPRDTGPYGQQPYVVDDRLFFYAENQCVYQWSTLVDGDDPPVFGRYENSEPWQAEDIRVSEHLILACLFEAVMCHAKFGASVAWLDEDRLTKIVRHMSPLAIAPWRWLGSRFYARGGAFMCAGVNGEEEGKKCRSKPNTRQGRTPAAIPQAAPG